MTTFTLPNQYGYVFAVLGGTRFFLKDFSSFSNFDFMSKKARKTIIFWFILQQAVSSWMAFSLLRWPWPGRSTRLFTQLYMLPLATSSNLNSIPFKEASSSQTFIFILILFWSPIKRSNSFCSHSAPEHIGKSFLRHASDVCCRTRLSHHSSSFRRHMGTRSRLVRSRILEEWTRRSAPGGYFKSLRWCSTGNNGYENGIHYDCES